jgi:uncharacterized protein (DUF2062 family)
MKQWLKKHFTSTMRSIKQSKQLKTLKPYLKTPSLWAYDCQSVARGVAAGLAGAVIPGFQIFYAAILVIFFRGNLSIALLATLVTNPFTALPIMYFICFVGTLVTGGDKGECIGKDFSWDFSNFTNFFMSIGHWVLHFGKSFLIGVPIVSIGLAIIGYFGTILVWKIYVMLFHKR